MSFDLAQRATECLLALALIQHSAEHLVAPGRTVLFLARIVLAMGLLLGIWPAAMLVGLWLIGLALLHRFDGPYNGGADKMALLVLTCLTLSHLAPAGHWQEMALAYLAVQLILSYFVSGWIKVINPDWRRGAALADVFRFSAYPVHDRLRHLADRPRLIWIGSWAVMGLELAFPLTLLHPATLVLALMATFAFHLCNAVVFGLNRFVWSWLSAYPALIWFQDRVLG